MLTRLSLGRQELRPSPPLPCSVAHKIIERKNVGTKPALFVEGSGVARPTFFCRPNLLTLASNSIFCLGHHLSKHKMTRYARNLGSMTPLGPIGLLRSWLSAND